MSRSYRHIRKEAMRWPYGTVLNNGYFYPPRGFRWTNGLGIRSFAVYWQQPGYWKAERREA